MQKLATISLVIVILFGLGACKGDEPKIHVQKDGLSIEDKKVGKGAEARRGSKLTIDYIGWYWQKGKKTKFVDTDDSGEPLVFTLGRDSVVRGWNRGLKGMRVGGKRWLGIPPALGYGTRGLKGKVPPNSILWYDIELLKVE